MIDVDHLSSLDRVGRFFIDDMLLLQLDDQDVHLSPFDGVPSICSLRFDSLDSIIVRVVSADIRGTVISLSSFNSINRVVSADD